MADWSKQIDELNTKWNEIINAPKGSWTIVKESPQVTVWQKAASDWGGMIYKSVGFVDADPETVFRYVDPFPGGERQKWEPTVKERSLVERVDETTVILRSVTHSAVLGLISSRDFVDIIIKGQDDESFYTRGVGVDHPDCPPTQSAVRGYNHPCGIICQKVPGQPKKTKMTTIIQTNLNGLLPKSVVEGALPGSQTDFFGALRKVLKADGVSG